QKTANDGRLSRDWCRVLATEGPPSGPGDDNGRTAEGTHAYPVFATDGPGGPGDGTGRSAEIQTAHPVLADDTGPGSPGDHNGRSAALVTGDWHPVLAG